MPDYPMVTVCTQAYNTEKYIEQCVESVLHQTFSDFEYLIVDNGSTDGTKELLQKYAGQDSRIVLTRLEENSRQVGIKNVLKHGVGKYLAIIDSDDWWDPDHLERLVGMAEQYDLDLACTGWSNYEMDEGREYAICVLSKQLIVDRSQTAELFPHYRLYLHPLWGKLIRMDLFRQTDILGIMSSKIPNYLDTIVCFELLKNSVRSIYDNTMRYHYRKHKRSFTDEYRAKYFYCAVCFYDELYSFLSSLGKVSAKNRLFIELLYIDAVLFTINRISESNLTPVEKLEKCREISEHPYTIRTFRDADLKQYIRRCRDRLLETVFEAGSELYGEDDSDLRVILEIISPRTGRAVNDISAPLFHRDHQLCKALQSDDPEMLLQRLLALLESGPVEEGFLVIARGLAEELDRPAILAYARLRRAETCLAQGELETCRALLRELERSGIADNERISSVRRTLEEG